MDLRQRMGEDWTVLANSVREMDVKAVEEYIDNALKKSRVHYRVVQRSLEDYCFSQVALLSIFVSATVRTLESRSPDYPRCLLAHENVSGLHNV